MANKMTDNNPNSSHLVWFANNVELFQFEGHEGFQLQGYHLPSIFSRATGEKERREEIELDRYIEGKK